MPLAPGERIDPNVAPEEELDRLPGIGPAAAWAIALSRLEAGGFTGVGDLARVRGIGPATVSRLAPYLTFGNRISKTTPNPGVRPVPTPEPPTGRLSSESATRPGAADSQLDLNQATEIELVGVRGIGPVLAKRIIAMRDQRGRFRRVEDLIDVRGIGSAKLRAIAGQLVVRR